MGNVAIMEEKFVVGLSLTLESTMIEEGTRLVMGTTTIAKQLSMEGVTPSH